MCVVTIRGQLGSGAPEIGRLIAEGLRADYVDREIIAKVAELLNSHEQNIMAKEMPPGSLLGRIAGALEHGYPLAVGGGYGLESTHAGAYMPTWQMPLNDMRYLAGLESAIKELASGGSIVIRGRGSQFILKGRPGAIHVLTVAPIEVRVRRIMDSHGLDEGSAKKEITRIDGSSREFIRRYFQADLESPLNYDLVVNTEHLTFQEAASVVLSAVSFKEKTASSGE